MLLTAILLIIFLLAAGAIAKKQNTPSMTVSKSVVDRYTVSDPLATPLTKRRAH